MDNLYGVKLDHTTGGPVSATDQNKRGKILNAQLNLGALGSLGPGVVFGWLVELVDGEVTVQAGQGIAYGEEIGYVAFGTDADETVDEVPETFPYHVFAQALIADAPTDPDSRLTFQSHLMAQEGQILDGAVLLARVNEDGTVTDLREPGIRMRLGQLDDDLGYDGDQRIKGTVAARLTAIETAIASGEGGGGEGDQVLWASLKRALGDPRTIEAVMDQKLGELADLLSGGATRENPEFRAIFEELGAQGIGLAEIIREWVYRSRSTTVLIDIVNDGSGGSPDDLNEGTAVIDHDTGTIGPA